MSILTVSVSEVAELNPRVPLAVSEDSGRVVDFVPMSQLSEQGYVEPIESRPLREVAKGYTYFQNGDVIVAKITPCMENGKAAFVRDLPHGIAFGSTEFHVLRPHSNIDGRYLFYMLWNPIFRHEAEGNMTGSAGQKRVPTKFFTRFKIPLPPRPEQERIAGILDSTFGIWQKHLKAARLANEVLGSLAHSAFKGEL